MNVPRTKPIIRHGRPKPTKKRGRSIFDGPMGLSKGGLHNDDFLRLVGRIVTNLPQIEEAMIEFMAFLMGGGDPPARQVFRALHSEDARVKVMRAMLEHARYNRDKGQEFDDVIDLFVEVKKKRNAYAHGLWRTHESGRCFLKEASTDEMAEFLSEREVKIGELETVIQRMNELWNKAYTINLPPPHGLGTKPLLTSPQKHAPPRP